MCAIPEKLEQLVSPEKLEHVDTIQCSVEQEVIHSLHLLLPRLGPLYGATQSSSQTDQSLNVSAVACTSYRKASHYA